MTHQATARALIRFDLPEQPLEASLVTFGCLSAYSVLAVNGRRVSTIQGLAEGGGRRTVRQPC